MAQFATLSCHLYQKCANYYCTQPGNIHNRNQPNLYTGRSHFTPGL